MASPMFYLKALVKATSECDEVVPLAVAAFRSINDLEELHPAYTWVCNDSVEILILLLLLLLRPLLPSQSGSYPRTP